MKRLHPILCALVSLTLTSLSLTAAVIPTTFVGKHVGDGSSLTNLSPAGLQSVVSASVMGSNVVAYGVTTNSYDCSSNFNYFLTNIVAMGGGTIMFPSGVYTFTNPIWLPTASGKYSVKITGQGRSSYWGMTGLDNPRGTVLQFCVSNAPGKIIAWSYGQLEIDHVTLASGLANTATPFLYTLSGILNIHDCSFVGFGSLAAADDDVAWFGDVSKPFNGYGTVVRDNWFANCRGINFGLNANAVSIINNTWSTTCGGTNSAVTITGSADGGIGNYIAGNTIEMIGFTNFALVNGGQGNVFAHNSLWDFASPATSSAVLCINGAQNNVCDFGYINAGVAPLVCDSSSTWNSAEAGGLFSPALIAIEPAGGQEVRVGGGSVTGSELKLEHAGTGHFSMYNRGNYVLTFADTSVNGNVNYAGNVLATLSSGGTFTTTNLVSVVNTSSNALATNIYVGTITGSLFEPNLIATFPPSGQTTRIGGGSVTGSEIKWGYSGVDYLSMYNAGDGNLTFADTSVNGNVNYQGTPAILFSRYGNMTLEPIGGQNLLFGGGNNTGSEVKLDFSGVGHFSIYNKGDGNLTFAGTSGSAGLNTVGTPIMALNSSGSAYIPGAVTVGSLAANGVTVTNGATGLTIDPQAGSHNAVVTLVARESGVAVTGGLDLDQAGCLTLTPASGHSVCIGGASWEGPPLQISSGGASIGFAPNYTGTPTDGLAVYGAVQTDNDTIHSDGAGNLTCKALTQTSDRDAKDHIHLLDPVAHDILRKVAGMPVSQWTFRGEDRQHVGPMAQDFYASLGLGDGHGISVIDAQGVTLLAVKGLYQQTQLQIKIIYGLIGIVAALALLAGHHHITIKRLRKV